MLLKIIMSGKHSNQLLSAIGSLYGKPSDYSDVEIHVGQSTFKCHKLILALQSTYFQERFLPGAQQRTVSHYTLHDFLSEDFEKVQRYLYTGEIELDSRTVERTLRLATVVQLDDLKQLCVQFMEETLDVKTCVQYWQAAQDVGDSSLGQGCLELFLKEFVGVAKASRLQDITHDMMKAAIERDDLEVNDEVELCEILMKWFVENNQRAQLTRPLELLSLIRWSGVNIEYIKSKMINNESLIKDQECCEFLSRVISYRLSGIQFPGLRTHHRPSTELETCVVIFDVNDGPTMTSDSYRVSLQSNKNVAIANVPTLMRTAVVACTNNSSVYVTGVGAEWNETWRWDSTSGWTRCGDLIQGRRRHCATFINNTSMYALGGWVESTKKTLSSVEQFNTMKNKWTTVGQLAQCVHSAGCVTYKTSIYVFGGKDGGKDEDKSTNKDVLLDCIQEYDTTTEQCTMLTHRLPQPLAGLRAVLWDKSVILMNGKACLIFDLDQKTIQQRDQFTPGVNYFGPTLDNQT